LKALRTTLEGGFVTRHKHVVYLNDENGFGACAVAEGHAHRITYTPPQEAQTDPETGEEVAAAVPGGWVIEPALDGHTHDGFEEYVKEQKRSEEGSEKILSDVLTLFKEAHLNESESIEKGCESHDFRAGCQWEHGLKTQLESQKRAALTINFTAKYVNEILGHEIQNRTDIRYLPTEDGDQRVADMLNVLVKHITNQCYYDREKTKVFLDEVVAGRGLFNIYVDFSRDLRGEIKIEGYPFKQFRAGYHEKEDLSDCEHIHKDRMFSIGKIKQLWPDKAEEVEAKYQDLKSLAEFSNTGKVYADDAYRHPDANRTWPITIGDYKLVDIARKEFRVIETWRKQYIEIPVVVNTNEDFYFNAHGWRKADLDSISTMPGFIVIKRPGTKMRITKVAGGVVLDDQPEADLPVDDFFVVPVYCNKFENKFWGKVEDVKDAQREVNKRHSQAVDIGNRMVSSLWFYTKSMFPDENPHPFQTNSSTPGAMIEVEDESRLPQQSQNAQFPRELVELMQIGSQHISELMNISIAPRGANTSASALLQEQKIRLTGNEYLFDAMSHAQVKVGRILIKLIQKYYTADRIYRILNNANNKQKLELGGQPFEEFTEDDIMYLLETSDLEHYDVEIGESPNSPSARLTTYTILSDLTQRGVGIPPEATIKFADIPDAQKNEIIQKFDPNADILLMPRMSGGL